MLNGDGNENSKKKKTAHFFSYLIFLMVFCTATTWNAVVTHLVKEMLFIYVYTKSFVACVPVRFFSLLLIFTLLTTSISDFLTANFHVFLPTKFTYFVFLWYTCGADGSAYGHVITKISAMQR